MKATTAIAIANAASTVALVLVTLWYAWLTRKLVEGPNRPRIKVLLDQDARVGLLNIGADAALLQGTLTLAPRVHSAPILNLSFTVAGISSGGEFWMAGPTRAAGHDELTLSNVELRANYVEVRLKATCVVRSGRKFRVRDKLRLDIGAPVTVGDWVVSQYNRFRRI